MRVSLEILQVSKQKDMFWFIYNLKENHGFICLQKVRQNRWKHEIDEKITTGIL